MNALPPRQFRCVALDAQGATHEQMVQANSEAQAAASLSARGLTPILVSQRGPSLVDMLSRDVQLGGRLNNTDLTALTERLALLLGAGLTVPQCLELEARGAGRKAVKAFAARQLSRITEGQSLAGSLAQEPKLPSYYVGVVRAAERGGRLAQGLDGLARSMKLADQTRQQFIASLTYPALVLISTFVALFFVLVYVIPNFEPLFEGETARLPGLTRAVLWLSHGVNNHGLLLLLASAASIAALWAFSRTGLYQQWWQARLISPAPLFDLIRTIYAGRAARVIGTQIINGVAVPEALAAAAQAAGSKLYADKLSVASLRVREGLGFAQVIEQSQLFPETAVKLAQVGEASGKLGPMLMEAAGLFEAQARLRLERLVAIANPLAILLLGGLVAGMIASVMLGIFSIQRMVL
jgi:general secretion pathway protein F